MFFLLGIFLISGVSIEEKLFTICCIFKIENYKQLNWIKYAISMLFSWYWRINDLLKWTDYWNKRLQCCRERNGWSYRTKFYILDDQSGTISWSDSIASPGAEEYCRPTSRRFGLKSGDKSIDRARGLIPVFSSENVDHPTPARL